MDLLIHALTTQNALFQPLNECTVDGGVATFACIPVLINNIVVLFMIGSAVATLIMIIIGGIKFVMSGGDPKQVASARSTITYAIVGIFVVFLSFFILNLLSRIIKNDCIDPTKSNQRDCDVQFEKPNIQPSPTP